MTRRRAAFPRFSIRAGRASPRPPPLIARHLLDASIQCYTITFGHANRPTASMRSSRAR